MIIIWKNRAVKVEDGLWWLSKIDQLDNFTINPKDPEGAVCGDLPARFGAIRRVKSVRALDDNRLAFTSTDGLDFIMIGDPAFGGTILQAGIVSFQGK